MSIDNERHLILQMVEDGKITPEEGLRLLQALQTASSEERDPEVGPWQASEIEYLESSEPAPFAGSSRVTPETIPGEGSGSTSRDDVPPAKLLSGTPGPIPEDAKKWHRFWTVPLWTGVGFIVFGALLMFWAQQAYGIGLWFLCAWVPFLIGLALVVLGWQSRTSRWLHLRVQQPPGEWPRRIALSFPLPLRPTAWFIRTFKPAIPGTEGLALDEVILALQDSTSNENPIFIEVEEGDQGERVEIYIG